MAASRGEHRDSGRTPAEEETEKAAEEFGLEVVAELPTERERGFQRTTFARMRLDLKREDRMMMNKIHRAVDSKIDEFFPDLITVIYELFEMVRVYERDEHGELVPDEDGMPRWKRMLSGAYEEHWERLASVDRERWINRLMINVVDWERRAEQARAEAQFTKGIWQEQYAIGFESLPGTKPSIPDREARARRVSAEDYYVAMLATYYSRMLDSYVRNMNQILLRISQIHQAAAGR